MKRCGLAVLYLAAVACVAIPPVTHAQDFPRRPVRMITELAAGTGGDVYLRKLFPYISNVIGQPVVLDNRPGAGGVVAGELVARATADGYTLLAASQNALIIRRFLSKTNSVDVFKDLVAITEIWKATTLILANISLPVKSLAELIVFARANPDKLSYGTSGFGTSHHFTGEQIQQLTGIRMVHLAYKGGVGSMQAAMTGEVHLAIGLAATAMPVIRSGKVRVLAIVEGKPFGPMSDVPTATDVIPGFEPPPSWIGLFGPARLPPPLLQRLNTFVVKALNSPEQRANVNVEGFELVANSPGEFSAELKKQDNLIGRIAKAANIQPTDN